MIFLLPKKSKTYITITTVMIVAGYSIAPRKHLLHIAVEEYKTQIRTIVLK